VTELNKITSTIYY